MRDLCFRAGIEFGTEGRRRRLDEGDGRGCGHGGRGCEDRRGVAASPRVREVVWSVVDGILVIWLGIVKGGEGDVGRGGVDLVLDERTGESRRRGFVDNHEVRGGGFKVVLDFDK